jgi:hypothetical protein
MASPQEKLADSLEALEALQRKGAVAVMKGWYIPARPDERAGESTAWYASFWDFCATYLEERFGDQWCLSPEQSLFLHAGQRTVPKQLLVRTPKGRNNATALPHERHCSNCARTRRPRRAAKFCTAFASTHCPPRSSIAARCSSPRIPLQQQPRLR